MSRMTKFIVALSAGPMLSTGTAGAPRARPMKSLSVVMPLPYITVE